MFLICFHCKSLSFQPEKDNFSPPPLAGHTLTLYKDGETESLIIIGGYSAKSGFLRSVWEYSLSENRWQRLNTTGIRSPGMERLLSFMIRTPENLKFYLPNLMKYFKFKILAVVSQVIFLFE